MDIPGTCQISVRIKKVMFGYNGDFFGNRNLRALSTADTAGIQWIYPAAVPVNSNVTTTGVYRPGAGFYLKMDTTGAWNPSTDRYVGWDNAAVDRPIAGDWNADGRTETGVYRREPGST